MLVTQLHDKNKTISSEALDILDEACEDKVSVSVCVGGEIHRWEP